MRFGRAVNHSCSSVHKTWSRRAPIAMRSPISFDPLGHRNEQDIHDADAADDQRYRGNRCEQKRHDVAATFCCFDELAEVAHIEVVQGAAFDAMASNEPLVVIFASIGSVQARPGRISALCGSLSPIDLGQPTRPARTVSKTVGPQSSRSTGRGPSSSSGLCRGYLDHLKFKAIGKHPKSAVLRFRTFPCHAARLRSPASSLE
jgi:hypothetical protein